MEEREQRFIGPWRRCRCSRESAENRSYSRGAEVGTKESIHPVGGHLILTKRLTSPRSRSLLFVLKHNSGAFGSAFGRRRTWAKGRKGGRERKREQRGRRKRAQAGWGGLNTHNPPFSAVTPNSLSYFQSFLFRFSFCLCSRSFSSPLRLVPLSFSRNLFVDKLFLYSRDGAQREMNREGCNSAVHRDATASWKRIFERIECNHTDTHRFSAESFFYKVTVN